MPASILAYGVWLALSSSVPDPAGSLSIQEERTAYRPVIEPVAGMKLVSFQGAVLPRWQEVVSRHDEQVSANRASWERLVSHFRGDGDPDLLQRVNQSINQARYVSDSRNWKTPDFWATPQELLVRGGDCEDFAIAKYLILRELGVSASHMQIAVTESHAILIVDTEDGPVVLDSANDAIRSLDARVARNLVFTVNELSWAVNVRRGSYQLASR